MISNRTLGLAIERAVITPAQGEALRAIESEASSPPAVLSQAVLSQAVLSQAVLSRAVLSRAVLSRAALSRAAGSSGDPPYVGDETNSDDEALRLVTGFADIFVTIGIGLFVGALGIIVQAVASAAPAFAAMAIAAWGLAEFFTRRRRMALPSIALLVVLVASAFVAMLLGLAGMVDPTAGSVLAAVAPVPTNGLSSILAALGTVILMVLHYLRFRVPITVAAGMAGLCVALVGAVAILWPHLSWQGFDAVILCCGVAVFAVAMRFDLADPLRATRRSDIAFWLHLLAAPLIVHTLVRGFLHGMDVEPTVPAAAGVLGVFVLLGLVAVIIDRRAILVSGLLYAGVAFGALIKFVGLGGDILVPIIVLCVGAFILLLSAGWTPLRRALLTCLPAVLSRRLPHPLVASAS